MAIFDNIVGNAEELAGKVGIPADQLLSIASSLRVTLDDGLDQMAALEKVAAEYGLPLQVIRTLLRHAESYGDLKSEILKS